MASLRTLWPQVRIDRVAAAVVAGGVAIVILELATYPEFEFGLAASLAALLLVLSLLAIAGWDVLLALGAPTALQERTPFLPIPSVLRPWLFALGLIVGLWFGSEHW